MTTKGKISLTDAVIQIKGNIVSDMDGEKVMLSITNGKYYNLGQEGGDIWGFIEEQITVNQVIEKLLSIYQVDQSECEEQVVSFLEMLLEEGLIEVNSVS